MCLKGQLKNRCWIFNFVFNRILNHQSWKKKKLVSQECQYFLCSYYEVFLQFNNLGTGIRTSEFKGRSTWQLPVSYAHFGSYYDFVFIFYFSNIGRPYIIVKRMLTWQTINSRILVPKNFPPFCLQDFLFISCFLMLWVYKIKNLETYF